MNREKQARLARSIPLDRTVLPFRVHLAMGIRSNIYRNSLKRRLSSHRRRPALSNRHSLFYPPSRTIDNRAWYSFYFYPLRPPLSILARSNAIPSLLPRLFPDQLFSKTRFRPQFRIPNRNETIGVPLIFPFGGPRRKVCANHRTRFRYIRSKYSSTLNRGQSPLRINDSRINGRRRATDAEFRICCAPTCAESGLLTARFDRRVFATWIRTTEIETERLQRCFFSLGRKSPPTTRERENEKVSGNESPPKNNYSYRCVNKRLPIYGRCKYPSLFLFRQRVIRLSVNRPRGRE